MYIGTVVVQNELIGVLVSESEDTMSLKTETGKIVVVKKDKYAEVANPYALACLYYKKLVENIRRT